MDPAYHPLGEPLWIDAEAPLLAAAFPSYRRLVTALDTGGAIRGPARADLYSFGAMVYALHVGRELTEMDFELQGVPKPFIPRFPDTHPALGRLVSKTFCREPADRST